MTVQKLIGRELAPQKALAFEQVVCSSVGETARLFAQFHGDWDEQEMTVIEQALLLRLEQDEIYWIFCQFDPITHGDSYTARQACWEYQHYGRRSALSLVYAIQSNSFCVSTPREGSDEALREAEWIGKWGDSDGGSRMQAFMPTHSPVCKR